MATSKRGAGRGDVTYQVDVVIAGREGTQQEIVSNKRESIRRAKGLIKNQPFGSASKVTMLTPGAREEDYPKRTMIFQAHVALARGGTKTVLKIDEL